MGKFFVEVKLVKCLIFANHCVINICQSHQGFVNYPEARVRRSLLSRIGSGSLMQSKKLQFKKIFIGAPYGGSFKSLQGALDDVPCRFAVAKDYLENKQLLDICRNLIRWADFCLFDVSTWNPNVTLELGLADGLGVPYYILCNSRNQKGVPSDIKGISRLTYSYYEPLSPNREVRHTSLWFQLTKELARRDKLLNGLWTRFPDTDLGQKQRYFASRILTSMRDGRPIYLKELPKLNQGLGLSTKARKEVLKILCQRNLVDQSSRAVTQSRKIFPASYRQSN